MLLEYQAKGLLVESGLPVPAGLIVRDANAAEEAARRLGGEVVLKAQVPIGGRSKAGAILHAADPESARKMADELLASEFGGHEVRSVLVEECVQIAKELYVAVANDPATQGPLLLLSAEGGVEIEQLHTAAPEKIHRHSIDIRRGLDATQAVDQAELLSLPPTLGQELASYLIRLYAMYRNIDAELVEVNPLAITTGGRLLSLDCKVNLDPGAVGRHPQLQQLQADTPIGGTALEQMAAAQGLLYIELDGNVGVLANGAGLTMATLDAVAHYGGRPANFLEIGGDAYTKAETALTLVLSNPNVKSLLINFCGAFARTDIMVGGLVDAIEAIQPTVPISFSIHGTGEDQAIRLVRERLAINPHPLMDDAVREAVEASRQGAGG